MKEQLKTLVTPLTNWYTGSVAVEKSSLSKFHQLDDQLKALKRYLEQMFADDSLHGYMTVVTTVDELHANLAKAHRAINA